MEPESRVDLGGRDLDFCFRFVSDPKFSGGKTAAVHRTLARPTGLPPGAIRFFKRQGVETWTMHRGASAGGYYPAPSSLREESFSVEHLKDVRVGSGAGHQPYSAGGIAQAVASHAMLSEEPGNQLEGADSAEKKAGEPSKPKIDLDQLARELAGKIQERLRRHQERTGR